MEDAAFDRVNGLNTATWSRKLVTADAKDYPIRNTTLALMFANGVEDYFTCV